MKEFIEKLKSKLKEKLLEYINKANDEMIENGHTLDFENHLGHKKAYENVLYEIVNELAEEYNNGWIPCSEKLPSEKDGCVLICDEKGRINLGKYSEHNITWYIGAMYAVGGAKVIAWMLLPEPYKEGE